MNLEFQIKIQTKEDLTTVQVNQYSHWLKDVIRGYYCEIPNFLIDGKLEVNVIDSTNNEKIYEQAEPGNNP